MENSLTFLWMLLQTIFALVVVCGLAYLIFRVILPRFAPTLGGNSMIRIVDRTGLEPRKNLYIIEVAGKWMLVAASEEGVQFISDLDPDMAREMELSFRSQRESRGSISGKPFSEVLNDLIGRKGGK